MDKNQEKNIIETKEGVNVNPVFLDENKSMAKLKKNQLDSYDELESYKILRKKRKKKAVARILVWLMILILVPIFVFFTIIIINPKAGNNFFGYTIYYVTSTSMVGVFDKGDCIVVKKVNSREDIKIGSDITFVRRSDGETVTHRVIDFVKDKNGEIEYITKGVNVPVADPGSVAFEDVLGVRISVADGLGKAITYFRTPYGIITFLALFVIITLAINVGFKYSDDIRAIKSN